MDILIGLGVFALAVAYNWVYTLCIRAMADGHAHRAALADTMLYLMSVAGLGALLLVGWWVIIPELLGQYVGTYLGTRHGVKSPAP